ncbi:hypothetical protein B5G27_06160 [Lachnoclostridium sp. An76]|nr:hypothetical protein B5G27_06160 [Lachnoclostridium sp. An76]
MRRSCTGLPKCGVIGKLDYIKELGADYIWLTPFFVSPQNDNGYDVEDYYNIDPRYGTMADVEELIAEADKRGIGLMFDMVFNHVSTRHEWFRKAMEGDQYYKDFFFFRKGKPDGPNIHKYLKELHDMTFGTDAEIVTVGEMSSTSIENCYQYAGRDTGELSMVFSFHHLKVDFMGNEKWVLVPADFQKLKDILFEWQTKMAEHNAWNAVFWCNHDQPRVVSRFGDEGKYWKESAKMLGTVIHCLRGTPYVYQGEEIGMTNTDFTAISQFRDVESLNHYQILQDKGMSPSDALRIVQVHSRDNGRTPMQWDDFRYAGFAAEDSAEPWIAVNGNHVRVNAADQLKDEDSIFHYYQKLIAQRKELDVIAYGDIEPLAEHDPSVFAYRRTYEGHELVMIANFYGKEYTWKGAPELEGFRKVLGNYQGEETTEGAAMVLKPYEAAVWYK